MPTYIFKSFGDNKIHSSEPFRQDLHYTLEGQCLLIKGEIISYWTYEVKECTNFSDLNFINTKIKPMQEQ